MTVTLATQGASQDTIGAGTDTLISFENLTGSAFNDTLAGNAGDNMLDGGDGTDTVSYAGAAAGVTVSLAPDTAQNTGGAGTDTLASIENLAGSAFGDTLTGDNNNNVISGLDGNDTLQGAPATTYWMAALATTRCKVVAATTYWMAAPAPTRPAMPMPRTL